MLVTINRTEYKNLNDASLIWACIEPAMLEARGRNFVVKSEVYKHLNMGQQAVFMFQMLKGHTLGGVEEFYAHLSYLLSNNGVWSQLKKGMQYFEDYAMVQMLERMEEVYQRIGKEEFQESAEQHNIALNEIDKNELSEALCLIDQSLSEILPISTKRVAAYIRDNVDEFMQIID